MSDEAAVTEAPAVVPLPEDDMPGEATDLAVIEQAAPLSTYRGVISDDELRRTWRLASALAQSGMFPDADEAPKALAKILMGHDLGLSPTQAMQGIHIVEGKPMLHYATLGGFVRSRPGYDFRKAEQSPEKCTVEFTRDNWETVLASSTFTVEMAKLRGLKFTGRNGQPTNWVKMPEVMCFARALSQGVRENMPEVLGGIPVYVNEERDELVRDRPKLDSAAEAEGLDLGPKVEEVLERAKALGHEGIADRATAEMALGNQSPQEVDNWVLSMHVELDLIDPEKQAEPQPGPTAEDVLAVWTERHGEAAHSTAGPHYAKAVAEQRLGERKSLPASPLDAAARKVIRDQVDALLEAQAETVEPDSVENPEGGGDDA